MATDWTDAAILDNVEGYLRENVATILRTLPKDNIEVLKAIDDLESGDQKRVMVLRAVKKRLEELAEEETQVIPEPVGDWPTHEHNGHQMCLIPRFRPAGHDEWHYVIGPLKDIHPLKVQMIRDRLEHVGGSMVWLFPYQVDELTFEPLPSQRHYGVAAGEVIQYQGGPDASDQTLKANW